MELSQINSNLNDGMSAAEHLAVIDNWGSTGLDAVVMDLGGGASMADLDMNISGGNSLADVYGLLQTIDTVLDAIKAQTDKLTFDGSNHLEVHTN